MAAQALDLSQPEAAEIQLEELVEEWESAWELEPSAINSAGLGASLQALGIVERQLGKPKEARDHLIRACELLADDATLPDVQEALALTLQDLGELNASESLLGQVLEQRRESPQHAEALAITLDHLGLNLLQQGRYPEVDALLQEAVDVLPEHSTELRAKMTGHRGRYLHTLGNHTRALAAFNEALAEDVKDPALRLSLRSQRALTLLRLGELQEASEEADAVAELARATFANQRLLAIPYLNNLGAVALVLGEFSEAEAAFSEVLTVTQALLGSDHPSMGTALNNVGVAMQQLGKFEDAAVVLEQALALQLQHHQNAHLRIAETRRNLARNALLTMQGDRHELVTAATRNGLEILEMLVQHGSERERLNFLERFDLVSLPCVTGDAEAIANVLLASKSRLLDAMLADTNDTSAPLWEAVQNSLAPGSAFVDTCRFRPLDAEEGLRYGAVLILTEGPPKWVSLGSERDLLDWLKALRERLSWQAAQLAEASEGAPALKLQSILKGLELQFWEPLASEFGEDVQEIAFSPDGALHFLPLAALLNQEGTPLSHRYRQVCTVASGRALVTPVDRGPLDAAPWTVMTISDFPSSTATRESDRLETLLAGLEPMPGTADEAKRLRKLAPESSTFLRNAAVNEEALRSLSPPPAVLHLGCHAFYVGPERLDSEVALDFDESAELLRSSGLVLYQGAEWDHRAPSAQDDLLFPEEIARLPLDGTRLVTLSSCDSGAGTPVGGEGILGLHRAFALAGADEVAVALWPVSDRSTPAFMERFYQLAKHSNRTAQALWQTQAEHLPTASHPDFEAAVLRYAPFNLSQNGPLAVGPAIDIAPLKPSNPWGLLVLGLALAVGMRWLIKRLQIRWRRAG